ncbi:hypothetical protein SCHPADRAFT_606577 [Schizopora paradoxa]|uniref:Uncharacterized protein n=1 Tax=Schizopora paradoxa TaxID=27342 RepID=A0A0H2R9G7_9AGAM|nr:hypothetical protein SCHPADRAFT_606577 [Schizopora paradoxa]
MAVAAISNSLSGWRRRPGRHPAWGRRSRNPPVRARRQPSPKSIFIRTAILCRSVRQAVGDLEGGASTVIGVIHCKMSVSMSPWYTRTIDSLMRLTLTVHVAHASVIMTVSIILIFILIVVIFIVTNV